MNQDSFKRAFNRLRDKEYRDAYVAEVVSAGIPFQVRSMRKDRKWSQAKLGQIAGKEQPWISELESDDKGSFTLGTLTELASAFDVGLIVKFVPHGRFLREYDDVSPEGLRANSYDLEASQMAGNVFNREKRDDAGIPPIDGDGDKARETLQLVGNS